MLMKHLMLMKLMRTQELTAVLCNTAMCALEVSNYSTRV